MQASVVMHNQLNVFMTVPSLFPNEEFLKPCMVVDVWQATASIHWVCQSELRVLEMFICTFHEANMHRRKSLVGVIHHITSHPVDWLQMYYGTKQWKSSSKFIMKILCLVSWNKELNNLSWNLNSSVKAGRFYSNPDFIILRKIMF